MSGGTITTPRQPSRRLASDDGGDIILPLTGDDEKSTLSALGTVGTSAASRTAGHARECPQISS